MALWYGIGIVLAVLIVISLIKKITKLALTGLLLVIIGLGVMHFVGVSVGDVYGYQKMSSAVKGWGSQMDYDRDNREFKINNDSFNLRINRETGDTKISGSVATGSDEAVKAFMGLFVVAYKVFSVEDFKNKEIDSISSDELAKHFSDGVIETLSNPERYMKAIESMDKNNSRIDVGNFKMYVEGDRLYVTME